MDTSLITKLLLQFGKHKPNQNNKSKSSSNKYLDALSELLLNPLKLNLKKDILSRAEKVAPQLSLHEGVYKMVAFLKKYNIHLNDFLKFDANHYGKFNKQSHSERVLVYATIIAINEKINLSDFEVVIDACKLHDISRNTIETDLLHGQKSVGIIKLYNLVPHIPKSQQNVLYAMVDAHSAYDKNIEGVLNKYDIPLNEYERVRQLCYILKDAEALDKVRFFNDSAINTERMLKSNQLKTQTAKQLVSFAFELNDYYNKNK